MDAIDSKSPSQRLILLRERLGLSQRDLAREFQVSSGAIASWETEARPIPGPILKLLELYENDGESKNSAVLTESDETKSLQSYFRDHFSLNYIKGQIARSATHQFLQLFKGSKGVVMKFAQLLSFIEIGLPETLRKELADLATQGQPVPTTKLRQVVFEELGNFPEKIFKEWSETPIAVTSLAQVHRARLNTGELVTVKVQNPEIHNILDRQFKNIEFMSRIASLFTKSDGSLLEEIRTRIYGECDYIEEAKNQMRFRNLWSDDSQIIVPKVYTEFSTKRILTSEYISGMNFIDFCSKASSVQKNDAGKIIHRFIANSTFNRGWMYADPHFSNMIFQKDKVAFVDFGRIVEYPPEKLDLERRMMYAFLNDDLATAKAIHLKLDTVINPEAFDFDELWNFLDRQQTHYMRNQNFRFSREHLIRLASDARRFSGRKSLKMDKWFFWAFFAHNSVFSLLADLHAEANWRKEVLNELQRYI